MYKAHVLTPCRSTQVCLSTCICIEEEEKGLENNQGGEGAEGLLCFYIDLGGGGEGVWKKNLFSGSELPKPANVEKKWLERIYKYPSTPPPKKKIPRHR
jgi:hypothetical protein